MAVKKTIRKPTMRGKMSTGKKLTAIQVGKLVNELKRSNLINLDAKISTITPMLSNSTLVAGYVLTWSDYVLVVKDPKHRW